MTIKIVFQKIGYSICFGDSAVSKCSYWFSITKEHYEGMSVVYDDWVCGYIRRSKSKRIFINKP